VQEAGLASAFAAARARLGLVAVLFVLSGVAWWSTVDRMRGMDDGPGTGLGTLGWFISVWLVMGCRAHSAWECSTARGASVAAGR
jgi:hypothetical protein